MLEKKAMIDSNDFVYTCPTLGAVPVNHIMTGSFAVSCMICLCFVFVFFFDARKGM